MAAFPSYPTRISILLRLYPRGWRTRYADEFAALLAGTALTPAKVLDIVLCALDTRWSGDYPTTAGDDRKVRHPMVDRLAALLTAAGGTLFAALMVIVVVAPPQEDNPTYIAWLLGLPMAMALLALGIAGLSLGWLGGDPIGRALGLVASGLAALTTLSILYLYFVGEEGFEAAILLLPGFAVASGMVGLRIALLRHDGLAGLVLVAAGVLASGGWLLMALLFSGAASVVAPLNVGIATVAWGFVGLLRLRPRPLATATA
jgi:hypothetical protein